MPCFRSQARAARASVSLVVARPAGSTASPTTMERFAPSCSMTPNAAADRPLSPAKSRGARSLAARAEAARPAP